MNKHIISIIIVSVIVASLCCINAFALDECEHSWSLNLDGYFYCDNCQERCLHENYLIEETISDEFMCNAFRQECTRCGFENISTFNDGHNFENGGTVCISCGYDTNQTDSCKHNNVSYFYDNFTYDVSNDCCDEYGVCSNCNTEVSRIKLQHTDYNEDYCCDICEIALGIPQDPHEHEYYYDKHYNLNPTKDSYCYQLVEACASCSYSLTSTVQHDFAENEDIIGLMVCNDCGYFYNDFESEEPEDDTEGDVWWDGYDEGYIDGYDDGFDSGFNKGEQEGYNNGYAVGKQEGYNNGYAEGYNKGTEGGEFENLFYSLFSAEANIFMSLLSFEILGINLAGFLIGLFSIFIFAWIIKKVI